MEKKVDIINASQIQEPPLKIEDVEIGIDIMQKMNRVNSFVETEINLQYDDIKFPVECLICFSEIKSKASLCPLNCEHFFCKNCIASYINEEINQGNVFIKCPGEKCKNMIPEEYLRKNLKEDMLQKYFKFLKRRKIQKIKDAIPCPILDCDSYAVKPTETVENNKEEGNTTEGNVLHTNRNLEENRPMIVKCVKYGHEFCSSCLLPPHPNESCKGILEQRREQLNELQKEKKDVKECPQCKIIIEKKSGCNHMTCTNCKYQFCWLCKKKYTPNHYDNPFSPCYRQQFNDDSPETRERAERMRRRMAMDLPSILKEDKDTFISIIIKIIFTIMTLSLAPGVLAMIGIYGSNYILMRKHGYCPIFIMICTGAIIGLILEPYFYIILGVLIADLFSIGFMALFGLRYSKQIGNTFRSLTMGIRRRNKIRRLYLFTINLVIVAFSPLVIVNIIVILPLVINVFIFSLFKCIYGDLFPVEPQE